MTNPGNLTDDQMLVLAQRIAAMAETPTDVPAQGVRQYVGARYVPVFANPLEWSDTREYEPLTIVTHQGNSFTSMQSVPTGIDIDNTEYWAITGNYNAQVEAYRKEVAQYDGRITDNANNITVLEGNLTTAETKLNAAITEEASARVNADLQLQGQINALNNQVAGLDPSKDVVVVIGDSIAAGWSNETPQGTGWPIYLRNRLGFPEERWIIEATGGAGFSTNPLCQNQVQSAADRVTQAGYSLNDVKMVIIGESVNDARTNASSASVINGVNATIAKCTLFPQAVINFFVGIMGNIGMNWNTERVYTDITDTIMASSANFKSNVWNAWTWNYDWDMTTTNNYVSSDNIHLKQQGQLRLARLIMGCLQGNTYEFTGKYQSTTPQGTNGPMIYRQGRLVSLSFASAYTTTVHNTNNLLVTCPKSYLTDTGCLGILSQNDVDTNIILFCDLSFNAISSYKALSNVGIYGHPCWFLNSPWS